MSEGLRGSLRHGFVVRGIPTCDTGETAGKLCARVILQNREIPGSAFVSLESLGINIVTTSNRIDLEFRPVLLSSAANVPFKSYRERLDSVCLPSRHLSSYGNWVLRRSRYKQPKGLPPPDNW